jgi:hypothetical protein
LARRYDPRDVDEKTIYPTIWTDDGDEGLDYLLAYYSTLQQFYADAAARGDAVMHAPSSTNSRRSARKISSPGSNFPPRNSQ